MRNPIFLPACTYVQRGSKFCFVVVLVVLVVVVVVVVVVFTRVYVRTTRV
jgi:hypothetical protein